MATRLGGPPAPFPRRQRRALLLAFLLAAAIPPLSGADASETYVEEQKLTASDPHDYDLFGSSTALDGDTALVGAPVHSNKEGNGHGSAYVYAADGDAWVEQARFTASDPRDGDFFGGSVALDGDTAVVGSRYAENATGNATGAVYVFTRGGGGWTQEAKLTASDGQEGDTFGSSVALDGDTVLVGAPTQGDALNTGAAYVFTHDGSQWVEQAKLAGGRSFGSSVALDGDIALVGAQRVHNASGVMKGAAYVYAFDGTSWNRQAELVDEEGSHNDLFGTSVALEGETALVGSSRAYTSSDERAGAVFAYTFYDESWIQEAKLTASDANSHDHVGTSVALDGGTALVGADAVRHGLEHSQGAAYVFVDEGTGWTERQKATSSDGASGDHVGVAVALDDGSALVGASSHHSEGVRQGAAYVFTSLGAETDETQQAAKDATQDDAGSGGDASDDPDDPTMLPGGQHIFVNGSAAPGIDTVDAYGTEVQPDTTRSMNFTFTSALGQRLDLKLYDPDGNLVDQGSTGPLGLEGTARVEAVAPPGKNLTAGTWTTVLEVQNARSTPTLPVPKEPAPTYTTPTGTLETPAPASGTTPGSPGVSPVVNLNLPLDYDGERRCRPNC